jgi:hypothetical protein
VRKEYDEKGKKGGLQYCSTVLHMGMKQNNTKGREKNKFRTITYLSN